MKRKRSNQFLVISALACSLIGSTHAANYQWDVNDSATGLGGTGTWNSTNAFWDLVGTAPDDGTAATTAPTFTSADTATFAGTAGTVTLGSTITVGNVNFNTAGYTLALAGQTLNLGNATGGVASTFREVSGSGIINVTLGAGTDGHNLGSNANFSAFTGTLNIGVSQAAASGKAQLSNTSAGLTSSATVNVAANSTLYVSGNTTHAAAITLNGGDTGEIYGQLRMDAGTWSGAVTLAGAITSSNDSHIGAFFSSGIISGVIGETGGAQTLITGGSGTVSISGINTYTGGTTVRSGVLNITGGAVAFDQANSRALGLSNSVTVNSGATLRNSVDRGVSGGQLTTRVVNLNGGTLNLANQDYFYKTEMTGGTISGASLYRVGNLTDSGLITTFASSTTSTISAPVDMTFRNLSLEVANGSAANDMTISGRITQNTGAGSGGKSITKTGAGTLLLSNTTNAYSGGTTITGGEVQSNIANSFGTGTYTTLGSGAVTANTGTTLRFKIQGSSTANFTIANAINLNSASLIYEDGNHILTGNIALTGSNSISGVWGDKKLSLNGIVSGAGSITHSGFSTLTLAGTNTYSGGTTLNGAALVVTNTSGLGSGGVNVTANSTVRTNTGFANNISVDASRTLSIGGGFVNVSGVISGAGNVTANDSIHLFGVNTYTGKTIASGGFLVINAESGLGATPGSFVADSLTLTGGGSLSNYLAPATVTLSANRGITLASGNTGALDAANGRNMVINGVMTGAGGFNKTGTGTLTLTGNNNYTGVTTLSNATLSVSTIGNGGVVSSNLGSASSAATNLVFNGGTLAYTGANATSNRAFTINAGKIATINTTNDISFAGATGTATTGGLTKTGTGKLTIDGINNYTGATNVNAGTLAVNGSLANTTTTVTSTTSARLQGSGVISGSVTIGDKGTIGAGNSIESLGVGALTLTNGSIFEHEILDNSATGADLVYSAGNLSLTGTVTLSLLESGSYAWQPNDKLTLISYSGSLTSNSLFSFADGNDGLLAENETFSFDGAQWVFKYTDTVEGSNYFGDSVGNFVTMTVIPEPHTALLSGIGLLALLRRRRK